MSGRINRYFAVLLLTAAVYCCLSACNMPGPAQKKAVEIDSMKLQADIRVVTNDSTKVQKNVADFLRWYKANYKKANSFPLLAKDAAGNFLVDKAAYTDYLNFLNSSNLVSSRFIGYWKTFFIDKEAELRKNKIKSDIPDGFDFDLILITQEPELILSKIDSIHFNIASMNDSVALVGLTLPSDSLISYEVEMYKKNNNWQVGYISTPNYD